MRDNRGFSLVELITVVGIMSLVGASAIPSLIKTLPERRLKRAAWQMYMDLQEAKAQAVSLNLPVELTVNNSLDQYTLWVDANDNGVRETDEKTVTSLDHLRGVDFYAYPARIVFSPTGTIDFPSSFNHFLNMQVTVSGVGTKHVYVFPNGHIDPLWIQQAL